MADSRLASRPIVWDDTDLIALYRRVRVWLAATALLLTMVVFSVTASWQGLVLMAATGLLTFHAIVTRHSGPRWVLTSVTADTTVLGLATTVLAIPAVTVAGLAFVLAVSTLLLPQQHAPVVWVYSALWSLGTAAVNRWSPYEHIPESVRIPAEFATLVFFLGGIAIITFVATQTLRRFAREQAEIRAELEARKNELAIQIASKDRFIATISHELRTPLTAVVGLSSELARHSFSTEEQEEFQQTVANQAAEVSYIVEDLLVAARADTGNLAVRTEIHDVHSTIESVVAGLARPVEMAIRGTVRAVADPLRLRQIVRNLLTNAFRYGRHRVVVEARRNGDRVTVQVRDDGPGVPSSDVDRIFEPYLSSGTPDTQPAAIGLGLSVARTLARLMGGDIRYHRDGPWSVFSLDLIAG